MSRVSRVYTCPKCGEKVMRCWVRNPLCRKCQIESYHPKSDNPRRTEEQRARRAEIHRLRFDECLSLQEIGDKFGVSRERIRQLLGENTGTGYKVRRMNQAIAQAPATLTNSEVMQITGANESRVCAIRASTRHAIAGGALKKGTQIEDMVSAKLSTLGIAHKSMPHHHPFDILLENGKRIDVKASFHKLSPPSARGEYYSFGTKKDKRGEYCDFFVLVVAPTMDMFIVPNEAVTPDCAQIHMNWPATRKPSKFHQYHNRFDLLKGE